MNFDFTDTQYALRDLARDLFAKESPPSRVRELWDGKPFDRRVWKTMAEAGICGITVPEAFGGAGGDELDLALVFEEAGRAALPEPLVETVGFAAPAIAEAGSDGMKERWLPAIAAGEVIAAVEGPWDGFVAWAEQADLLIASRNEELHALPRERFRATPIPSVDPARPLAVVETDAGDDTVICRSDQVPLPRAGWRALYGTSAVLNGISIHLLEATVAYVKDREQFGRPVGSFQAVKHRLASMHVAIESSRPATWYCGHEIATGADASVAASVAKVAAVDAEALCNREALQCHGGIGFTWEHDLHLWLKRGLILRSTFGTQALHRNALVPTAMEGT